MANMYAWEAGGAAYGAKIGANLLTAQRPCYRRPGEKDLFYLSHRALKRKAVMAGAQRSHMLRRLFGRRDQPSY